MYLFTSFAKGEELLVKVGEVPLPNLKLDHLNGRRLFYGQGQHGLHFLILNVLLTPFGRNVRPQMLGELHFQSDTKPMFENLWNPMDIMNEALTSPGGETVSSLVD